MNPEWDGVAVGDGNLAGKGVYATRDFAAGEPVVFYELVPLSREDFERLPDGEELFVHSYGGRRWLYPPPARWVNHSDDPSCFQDFDRACDTALRPIRAGEAVTIDAGEETAHELSTFIDAYIQARNTQDTESLLELVDPDAIIWRERRRVCGHHSVVDELIADGPIRLAGVEWLIGTGRWEALCSAEDRDDSRHLTASLKVIAGNWQVLYEHRG
ncbi:MAG: SET domain-containing protein-lysine N-methyltransferase [Acidimicrobiales bacterium]